MLDSLLLHLRAECKSAQTVKTYGDGIRGFLSWCQREDVPPALDRPTVNAWIAARLSDGAHQAPEGPPMMRVLSRVGTRCARRIAAQ